MKPLIGIAMLVLPPFVVLFTFKDINEGIIAALAVFGITTIIVTWFAAAVYFLIRGKQ